MQKIALYLKLIVTREAREIRSAPKYGFLLFFLISLVTIFLNFFGNRMECIVTWAMLLLKVLNSRVYV